MKNVNLILPIQKKKVLRSYFFFFALTMQPVSPKLEACILLVLDFSNSFISCSSKNIFPQVKFLEINLNPVDLYNPHSLKTKREEGGRKKKAVRLLLKAGTGVAQNQDWETRCFFSLFGVSHPDLRTGRENAKVGTVGERRMT